MLTDNLPAFDASTINSSYMVTCMHYIHKNAYKAGLVKKIEDWDYSSFSDYIGKRNGKLCNKELLYSLTGFSDENFYEESYKVLPEEVLSEIF